MYQVVMLLLQDKLVSSDANNPLLVLVLQLWLNLVQFFFYCHTDSICCFHVGATWMPYSHESVIFSGSYWNSSYNVA